MADVYWLIRDADVDGLEELEELLDEEPGLIEAEYDGRPPLFHASHLGLVEAAELLLDRGADANRSGASGETPLMTACRHGDVEMVRLLLGRGADPSIMTPRGQTALMLASLGDRGFKFEAVDYVKVDHRAVVRLLIKDGRARVDARDEKGRTALWRACSKGFKRTARLLLRKGFADPAIADDEGDTPMAIAQRKGRPGEGCVRLLKWYEGELHKVFLLSKARAVLDATDAITKAPNKAKVATPLEAQRAREEAAPAWLRVRVGGSKALPVLEVVGQAGQDDHEAEKKREEMRRAISEWLVSGVSDDLYVEVMEGLDIRRRSANEVWEEEGEEGKAAVREEDDDSDEDADYDDEWREEGERNRWHFANEVRDEEGEEWKAAVGGEDDDSDDVADYDDEWREEGEQHDGEEEEELTDYGDEEEEEEDEWVEEEEAGEEEDEEEGGSRSDAVMRCIRESWGRQSWRHRDCHRS